MKMKMKNVNCKRIERAIGPRSGSIPHLDESGCGTGIGGCDIIAALQAARYNCFPRTQGGSPGLKDDAPLALIPKSLGVLMIPFSYRQS